MTYTVHMLYLNQGEPPPTKQLEGEFSTVEEAWEAGRVEVLACQLRAVEAGYQIHDSAGRLVDRPDAERPTGAGSQEQSAEKSLGKLTPAEQIDRFQDVIERAAGPDAPEAGTKRLEAETEKTPRT